MPDTIHIDGATIEEAKVSRVELLDRVDLGPARVASVDAKQLKLAIEPGSVHLHGVKARVELHPSVSFGINPKGPLRWDYGWDLPSAIVDVPLPDLELPRPPAGFHFDVSVGDVRLGDGLEATLDPILAAQVPTLLANLVVERIGAGSVVLPTGGFDLTGLRLDELVVRGLAMGDLTMGATSVQRVRSGGSVRIPRLLLRGLALPRHGTSDIDLTGFQLKVDLKNLPQMRKEFLSDLLDVYAELKLRFDANVQSFVRFTIHSIRLSDVSVSGTLDALALQGLDLAFDARGLKLGPTEARDVKADAVRLVHQP